MQFPISSRAFAGFAAFLAVLTGCANPVPPSGGPRDATPPAIATSDPAADAVNVDTTRRSIRITFTEYMEIGTARQALSVSPAFSAPLEFEWDGRTLTVTLPEALRENTTYLLTFGTALADVHGVALDEPTRLAFGTGPDLNRGTIAGRVVAAPSGAGVAGIDVYAYAAPDSMPPAPLPERPLYRTQTGADGRFLFEYLSEQPYYVIALADDNRNRRPDPRERFAAPPRPAIFADSTLSADSLRWIAARRDTIPPRVLSVEPRSNSRLALRFDEPVRLTARRAQAWTLRDSLADATRSVQTVYQRPDAPASVFLRTEPSRAAPYVLVPPAGAVVDTSGNPLAARPLRFTGVDRSDTLAVRFLGFFPEGLATDTTGAHLLLPSVAPGVQFNQPVDSTRLRLLLSAETPGGPARAFDLTTPNGTSYRLRFSPPLAPGEAVRVRVAGAPLGRPDTTFARTFRRISDRKLGALAGAALTPDSTVRLTVQLYPVEAPLPVRPDPFGPRAIHTDTTDSGGQYLFSQLPEGTYRSRAFLDRDGDGRWDPGQLVPYRPAEPLTWSTRPLTVRPRWEVVAEDTLRISDF